MAIRGRRVDPGRRATRGSEGPAPPQARSPSTIAPRFQRAARLARSSAGAATSTAIAQTPGEDKGAHDHDTQRPIPEEDPAPEQEPNNRGEDDGAQRERSSQPGQHGAEQARILESHHGERNRSHDDQHHCGKYGSSLEIVRHVRHPETTRVANQEGRANERGCRQ